MTGLETAALASVAAGGLSSIANAIFGGGESGMTWSDYEKQLGLAQEQWKENRSLYALQRENYLHDLQDIREYDSASAQVERLRQAGINPAFAFGEGNFNNSTVQAPTPASPSAPAGLPSYDRASVNSELWRGVSQVLGASVDAFLNTQLKKEQVATQSAIAKQEESKAIFSERMNYQSLLHIMQTNKRDSVEYKMARANLDLLLATKQDRIDEQHYTTENVRKQASVIDASIAEMNSRTMLNQLNAQLAPLHLRVEQSKAQSAMLSAQAAARSAAAAEMEAQTHRTSSEYTNRLTDASIDKVAAEAADVWIKAAGNAIDYKQKDKYKGEVEKLFKTQLQNENTKESSRSGLLPLYLTKEVLPSINPIIGLGR